MTNKYKTKKNKVKKSTGTKKDSFYKGTAILTKVFFLSVFVITMGFSFILSHDIITQCEYFSAKEINIIGNKRLQTEEIMKTAGISKDINILALNISIARKKLLNHPWIKEVEIERKIPDSITITMKEHVPLAIIDIGQNFLIDMEGKIIKRLRPEDRIHLPVVNGLELIDINDYHNGNDNHYTAVLDILKLGKNAKNNFLNKHIKTIVVDRELGITIHTDKSIKTIKLGFHNFEKKYKRIQEILIANKKEKYKDSIGGIDLHNPNRIVITPVSKT